MKVKKKVIIVIILLIIVSLIGMFFINYKDRNTPIEVQLNKSFKLPVDKTAIVDKKLKVRLLSTSDSRCKDGLQCIWQGEISYTIRANDKILNLGTVKTKKVNYKDYVIKLSGNNDSTKFVKLEVERKD